MKLFATIAVSAGLVVTAGCANAQMMAPSDAARAHYQAMSDFEGPYGPPPVPPATLPRPYGYGPDDEGYAPPPRYGYGPRYGEGSQFGYGPPLMPIPEVYAVLRDNGFSPLGVPRQRGFVYVIAAVDRGGQDGRLVIDRRSGQIIRFMPAYRWGLPLDRMRYQPGPPPQPYGAQAALRPPAVIHGTPPAQATAPQVASRSVPMPAPKPATAAKPVQPPQQSAAVVAKPAAAPPPTQAPAAQPPVQASAAPPQPNATVAQSKPAPQILPTQEMPKAQGLE